MNHKGSSLHPFLSSHLCERELCGLAKEDLFVTRWVGMVLVLFEPLDEWDGSLGGQLVAGGVVRELWEGVGERVDRQGRIGTGEEREGSWFQ